jgi:hypothetical protein
MMRLHPAAFLILTCALGCGEHHSVEPHACSGLDAYFQTEWVRDGVTGQSRCNEPLSGVERYDPWELYNRPELEISFGGIQERPGMPFCGVSALFINTPLVTGDTGTVSDDRWGFGDGYDPVVYVGLRTGPDEASCAAGGADFATVTGGTWEVLEGGDEGDRVEIVIRDITFAPFEGHTFEYTRFRWRGVLGAGLEM